MPLKTVFRILIQVLIIIAFYFVFMHNSGNNEAHHHQRGRGGDGSEDGENRPRSPRSERPRDRSDHGEGNLEANSGVACSSEYLAEWAEPTDGSCQIHFKGGFPLPDARCTPGGINPSISVSVLRDPRWRTRMVRNCAVSEAQKHVAYRWYNAQKPKINSNENQVCELDHLVPLEIGGADGMGNIWPQCGPDAVTLNERYFKQKDRVENYLAGEVKAGSMPLLAAQQGIASDWTQYIPAAMKWCSASGRC